MFEVIILIIITSLQILIFKQLCHEKAESWVFLRQPNLQKYFVHFATLNNPNVFVYLLIKDIK